MSMKPVIIIGAGLAGSEAALVLSGYGVPVKLYEMKPEAFTPAHKSENFAELVCSNSFKSKQLHTAPGLQKAELKKLGSPLIEMAEENAVPAGAALAVDREAFSREVTEKIKSSDLIEICHEEVSAIPETDAYCLIATGPLTQGGLFEDIQRRLHSETLHFFDAAAPIVSADSVNMDIAFMQSRYDKGEADYVNCPFSKEEYEAFYQALITAELAEVEGFDKEILFQGCMPVESMAKRGEDTLRFGPLKPVGLRSPHTGKRPYAVVQLRREDRYCSMYNMVGFQTRLKFSEQKRVFRMIPGLEKAEFLRYGVMHRNSYIASDRELTRGFCLKTEPHLFFAGQITGLEGYVSAIASGHLAARNIWRRIEGLPDEFVLPEETINGQLARYLSEGDGRAFQPMNANFGLLPPLPERIKKKQERYRAMAERALESLDAFLEKEKD